MIMVDGSKGGSTDFGFTNKDGDLEFVRVETDSNTISLFDSCKDEMCFYINDIDSLIKALQAAKDYINKGK